MDNLYFKAFEKYGAALAMLYPSQVTALQDALEIFSEVGKIPRIEDCFVKLAFMMIVCDLRYQERKERP